MRSIRIFRYSRESGKYTYEDHEASIYIKERERTENAGAKRCVEGSVRIMTVRDIKAAPGDYVSLYKEDRPNKGRDYMVTAVRDNRRGALPHWRLIMEVVA